MNIRESQFFIGIDVQIKRGCPYLVLNRNRICVSSGWLVGKSRDEICENLIRIINGLENNGIEPVAIGIDSPRVPLTAPRQYFWDGIRTRWRERRDGEQGYGRHCEVVLKALNIANPQWTPIKENCPPWMELGFDLFSSLENRKRVEIFEVFPTASYAILKGCLNPKVTIDFSNFDSGPKDMIDACISAVIVLEYL
jgi:hypothetical protein